MLNFPTENRIEQGIDGAVYRIKIYGQTLQVIAATGLGWDHVSVTHKKRTPTWHEMCHIREMFFDDEDTVVQFHPPKSMYVNDHPRCLHLWRKIDEEIELPPVECV